MNQGDGAHFPGSQTLVHKRTDAERSASARPAAGTTVGSPVPVTDHEPRRARGSCAEAPGPLSGKLPVLGAEQRCCETPPPRSLFLPGAYKAQMDSDIWTNTKKAFFFFHKGKS